MRYRSSFWHVSKSLVPEMLASPFPNLPITVLKSAYAEPVFALKSSAKITSCLFGMALMKPSRVS